MVVALLLIGVVRVSLGGGSPLPLAARSSISATTAAASSGASTPASRSAQAVQLRTSLERLLGQHVFLSARLVRSRIHGDPSYVQAAVNALAHSTDDLTALIVQVYGPGQGPEFRAVWESHEASIVSYARALVDHDEQARDAARFALAAYPARMTSYLQTLTSGALPAAATESAIRQHVANQLTLADSVAKGDVTGSYVTEREDYGQLYRLATAIAAGIAKQGGGSLPPDFDSPQRRLDSALGELLGAHWELAVDLMQAAPAGGPTFDAVGNEVNLNTNDLAAAMNVLFGEATANRFLNLWGRHLEALVTYAQSVTSNDASNRQAALTQLSDFEHRLGQLLSTGTGGKLTAPQLADAYVMHDQMLLGQFDAFARHDFPTAYLQDYQGYQHMFGVADALATAIGPELAKRLPAGGVHTGGGGLAL
ncbi:MAG: hypothetical protein QOG60_1477 [Frankiaceae bacterium]|nr:hypothetical protein [Frankiaceae bacterium]